MNKDSQFILELEDIAICYRSGLGLFNRFRHTAIDGVSFGLRRGEVLGLLGRNGCGKSSLLRIMSGIIDPTRGRVICDNNVKRSILSLGLGFRVDLTGRDNALISAMLQGIPKKQAQGSLEEIRDFSELGNFFDRPVRSYSAGMRARLGFSTGLMTSVDILLIDEVLSVGDAHFRQKAEKAMLEKINSDQTVVFVSHNPEQVNRVCNRAIWLEGGKIVAEGETQEIAAKYKKFMQGPNTTAD